MTAEQFAYWLQGFAELNQNAPTQEQWQSIREHVATVFKKETPPVGAPRVPDLKDSPLINDLIESAKKHQNYNPLPYFPGYWLERHGVNPEGPFC